MAGWLVLLAVIASLLLVIPFIWLTPPTSSFMLRHGGRDVQHSWVALEMISPHLQLAVIAAEDQRFPSHAGFDFYAIRQALLDYRRGRPLRGASTITQQVAKNLYLWPERSLLRKLLEGWFTLLLELFWPKQRILEVYLNVAQFGRNVYGAEAASWRFFQRPASALARDQAALLAAVLPGPAQYRVEAPSLRVRRRQVWIMQQMTQLGGPRYLDRLH